MSLNSLNNPNLECFYLAIQVGLNDMKDIFGLPGTLVTWESKLTSTQHYHLGGDFCPTIFVEHRLEGQKAGLEHWLAKQRINFRPPGLFKWF